MIIKKAVAPFAIGCLLAACVQQGVEASIKGNRLYSFEGSPISVYVYKDPHTGCEYLVTAGYNGSGGGITPRLNRYSSAQVCGQ